VFILQLIKEENVPQCDAQGAYLPKQCHGSTGMCWCITDDGKEIAGTRTRPGHHHVVCLAHPTLTKCQDESTKSKTVKVGSFNPACLPNGDYAPMQCHGSTGMCWCVTSSGAEIPGTRTQPGHHHPSCVVHAELSSCESALLHVQQQNLVGSYMPQCEKNGQYSPKQCHGSTGHCWCVDSEGHEIEGTRAGPGKPQPKCHFREVTKCEKDRAQQSNSTVVGAFVPHCEADGSFSPVQCNGSTGYCWCVDKNGATIVGTQVQPGSPRPTCSIANPHPHPKPPTITPHPKP